MNIDCLRPIALRWIGGFFPRPPKANRVGDLLTREAPTGGTYDDHLRDHLACCFGPVDCRRPPYFSLIDSVLEWTRSQPIWRLSI
jgi:hypothetical protein